MTGGLQLVEVFLDIRTLRGKGEREVSLFPLAHFIVIYLQARFVNQLCKTAIRLNLALLEWPLKTPPKVTVEWLPERPSFRASSGPDSAALGPALQGYTVEG